MPVLAPTRATRILILAATAIPLLLAAVGALFTVLIGQRLLGRWWRG